MASVGFDRTSLERFILEKMSKTGIPGLSIAVLSREKGVFYARGFGFRDIESGLPATASTVYGVGSVTKSFTALAVMQLVERGLLSLDDPLERYVDVKLRPYGEPVRIRHLLTHTSGIPALAYAEALIRSLTGEGGAWMPIASSRDIVTFIRGAESWAEAKPGEKFFYLNEGYALLGLVIERVTGLSYEDYLKQSVFSPLEMSSTCIKRVDFERIKDRATPYIVGRGGKRVRSTHPFGVTADGGIMSSVLDLSKYLQMYLGRGTVDGKTIISPESIAEMEKPRIKVPFGLTGSDAYGYGWIITPDFLGYRLVWHSGSVLVSTAFVGYMPEAGYAVAVLANGSGYPLSYIGAYALALALGHSPERDLPFIRFDEALDSLVGTYETCMGTMTVTVERLGDILLLKWRGRYTEHLAPLVPDELGEEESLFYTIRSGRRVPVVFRTRNGRVELIYDRYKMVRVGPAR